MHMTATEHSEESILIGPEYTGFQTPAVEESAERSQPLFTVTGTMTRPSRLAVRGTTSRGEPADEATVEREATVSQASVSPSR